MTIKASAGAKPAVHELVIDARGVYYRDLNAQLREAVAAGTKRIKIVNLTGQRYIGTDLPGVLEIELHGTPGNDLAAFMDGPQITVHGNVQDGTGNTMNGGAVVVHGRGGDVLGYSMRGGKIFVRDDVGYRAGIHMKQYEAQIPTIVVGGSAQPFLGEYMGGGRLLVLGLDLNEGEKHKSTFIGTGMHGGVIYLRGEVDAHQLGKEVGVSDLDEDDWSLVRSLVEEYAGHFAKDAAAILSGNFIRLKPQSLRPYGRLYAY